MSRGNRSGDVGVSVDGLEAVLESVAVAVDRDHVAVVEEPVEDGGGEDLVTEHLSPLNWGWHLFLWVRVPCDLGVSGVGASL